MDDMNLAVIGAKIGMIFIPFLFALCFHEFAHGLVAKWRGDNTAEMAGRLSLNPFVHADPIGTFLLPMIAILTPAGFFFGWAKPVPVNSRNLRRPKWDMFWIAVAGPASNFFLALVATVALGLLMAYGRGLSERHAIETLLQQFMSINLFLAVFNLIPVHPLDGGKVLEPFLPYSWNNWLRDNESYLNMGLLLIIFFAGWVLAIPVMWMSNRLAFVSDLIGYSLG
jgi:Zn-dependent protease